MPTNPTQPDARSLAAEIAELALAARNRRQLKFSKANAMPRYRWGSVETDSEDVVKLLCLMFNNTDLIVKALKKMEPRDGE